MISTQKPSELYENQRCSDEKNNYCKKLPAAENVADAGNKAVTPNQNSYPDAEWRRSKSARFQQN